MHFAFVAFILNQSNQATVSSAAGKLWSSFRLVSLGPYLRVYLLNAINLNVADKRSDKADRNGLARFYPISDSLNGSGREKDSYYQNEKSDGLLLLDP